MKTQKIEEVTKLQLYVWTGFCPDYTDGLAFAIAPDETTARELITEHLGFDPYIWDYHMSFDPNVWGALSIYPLDTPVGFGIQGGG